MKSLLSASLLACALLGGAAHAQQAPKMLFADQFDTAGALSSSWIVSTWSNGHPFGCAFSSDNAVASGSLLGLSFSGATGKCAEVRIAKPFQYGRFKTRMKPSPVPGVISSFFLYDGAETSTVHPEIDIEFIGGDYHLHTNYWVNNKPYYQKIDLRAYGIDPFSRFHTYGFEWRANGIVWFMEDDAGRVTELRRAPGKITSPMRLLMNAWYGNNQSWALEFPGYYDGTPGVVYYDKVIVTK